MNEGKKDRIHDLEVRLDRHGFGLVKLDGRELHTDYVKIESEAGKPAKVTLGLYASVNAQAAGSFELPRLMREGIEVVAAPEWAKDVSEAAKHKEEVAKAMRAAHGITEPQGGEE